MSGPEISYTNCSPAEALGWIDRVKRELEAGNTAWLLSTPGTPAILAMLGATSLEASGAPPLTLGCCGESLVRVNGGGLYTELDLNPSLAQVYPVRVQPLEVDMTGLPGVCRGEPYEAIVSPLGWPNLTPLAVEEGEGPRGCVQAWGASYAPPGLEPLNAYKLTRCSGDRSRKTVEVKLGVFRVGTLRVEKSSSTALVGEIEGHPVIYSRGTRTLLVRGTGGPLEVSTPYYDTTVTLLTPMRASTIRVREALIEANALSVGGPLGSLALASSKGVRASIEPGLLRLEPLGGTLRITLGGILTAARLLHEDALLLRLSRVCGRGLGHMRAYNAISYLVSLKGEEVTVAAYSPWVDGRIEIRWYVPVKRASAGGVAIPVEGDLVRLPVPYGACEELRVKFGGFRFRLGRREG